MFDNAALGDGGAAWFGGAMTDTGWGDRAGVSSDRARGRLLLRGQLDEVGLDDLLGSLGARGRTCVVSVRSPKRQGEIVLERGRVLRARADGVPADADVEVTLAALRGVSHAVFDVLALDERGSSPPPRPPFSEAPPASLRPAMLEGNATEVALAAAVMNACSVYTRKWLGPKVASSIMQTAWARTAAAHAAMDAFRISADGLVTVVGVERARSAIPKAVATWVFSVFEAASMFHAARFQRYNVPEMLGGLMRLLDKGGWGEAFRMRDGGVR
ncbi:DUF4388 domain-containing protein [Polyangium jinanense]|uniref:DUF4388 domain-containing protein n=1 Tax=Polyangium jinanense TaxID=2829994 RepID=A0A9X3X5T2_9BACT|nr:DUF4388 domain-containing protein [Polyangium jinanense]MDC3954073.1 DUF4388 domain-containing protein [Polyangium jinanense]MDC3981971.1 DUF4388 domain-containing protein [Polyangium jinanense]